jgi:GT2 family glycosyltransferase
LRHTFLFDPNFFQGLESVDLAERTSRLGFKIRTCPLAVVHHLKGGTTDQKARERMHVLLVRNSLLHTLRNKGWRTFLGTLLFAVCWSNICLPLKNKNIRWAIINVKGIFGFFIGLGKLATPPRKPAFENRAY